MVVQAQMDLAVAADSHAYGVVCIQDLLYIVGQGQVLPLTQRR
jgi:hypothetical protein